jgi:hypothetical protein
VSFDPKWGGPEKIVFDRLGDWRNNENPGVRYYSGTAFYRQTFTSEKSIDGKQLYMDLGKVKNIARVKLNGKDLGIVWTSPWRVDISKAIKQGKNELTIEVVNLWVNRLIGDEQPTINKYTFSTYKHYRSDSRLMESGLIDPIVIGETVWE